MSYTDTVRQYCAKHKFEMLEVAKVREKEFADVPYKTLLKILNRLEEERIVTSISKGIYHIGPQILNEDKIISKYTSNGKGMLIGYSLFNSIRISRTWPYLLLKWRLDFCILRPWIYFLRNHKWDRRIKQCMLIKKNTY